MPNYRDYQKAMHQGPFKDFDTAMEEGIDNPGLSELLPPHELNTGPVDDRTQLMNQALEYFGSKSRMPHIDPDIHAPDPGGALRSSDLGPMNEWNQEGDVYNLLDDKRVHYPEGTRLNDLYQPGATPEDSQALVKQLLEEYLARGKR